MKKSLLILSIIFGDSVVAFGQGTGGGAGGSTGWQIIAPTGAFSITVDDVACANTGTTYFNVQMTDYDLGFQSPSTYASIANTWADCSSVPLTSGGLMPSGVSIQYYQQVHLGSDYYSFTYKVVTTSASSQTLTVRYTAVDADEYEDAHDGNTTTDQTIVIGS